MACKDPQEASARGGGPARPGDCANDDGGAGCGADGGDSAYSEVVCSKGGDGGGVTGSAVEVFAVRGLVLLNIVLVLMAFDVERKL